MSRILKNPDLRWFSLSLLLTFGTLAGAFLLHAASNPGDAGSGTRAATYNTGGFAFSAPLQMPKANLSPIFFQQDAEPEIKVDVFGNIYLTAINGVPGGTDLWKSTNKGTSFQYLGQPDGLQDKCSSLPQCAGVGGGDDSIDVSTGGYLYVTSLYLGSVTVSTSMDGGTGGAAPGQAWTVNAASTTVPVEDREWVAAYGPQTLNMTYRQAPGTGRLLFSKSTDAGKTFSPPVLLTSADSVEGNLVVDPFNGTLYTTFIPTSAPNRIDLLKSKDGGATWTTSTVYTGAAGTSPGQKFTILAVDRGGNVHLVFSRSNLSNTGARTNVHVFLTSSADQGATWTTPVQVDSGGGNGTAVMPWIVGGSPGTVDITWLGSSALSPDAVAAGQPQQSWQVFFAQGTNVMSASPTFNQVQVTTNPVHDTNICFNGTGCSAPNNRDLLEYYTMAVDPEGNANIAFADSVNNCPIATCKTNAWYSRQASGASIYTPPAGPPAATFAANIEIGKPGGEPSIWVDTHNCIYVTAPGGPSIWKSENNGVSFLPPVKPAATGLTGGDEDIITLAKPDGTRPDMVYFTDLGISSDHIFKSTDGGKTYFKPGPGGSAGETGVSSDRQWLGIDRIGTDQYVYEIDHEFTSEIMRLSSSANDNPWVTQNAMTDPELTTSVPNTNPGPTFVDKKTHVVYGIFNASIPTTNAQNPPFGKLLNIWDFVAAAPPVGGTAPGPFSNFPIFKGVIDSPTTPAPPAGTTTYGTNNANIFPVGDTDTTGNVYAAWSMNNARTNEFAIWFAASHDGGKTFYGPFQISKGPGTAVLPWLAAGDDGRVDVVWYQTSTVGDPNLLPKSAAWNVMFGQSLNASGREPVFTVSQASDHVNHVGPISTGGLIGSSDRSLLDYFEVNIGPDGLANIAYADNGTLGAVAAHAEFARQNGGALARVNPVAVACLEGAPNPTPVPTPTPAPTATPTPAPTPVNVQLANISGRLVAQTGDRVGIGGFIVSGSVAKRVILRGMGPSLQANAKPVPGTLQDPVLELHQANGEVLLTNDNWRGAQEQEIKDTGLAPGDDRESAMVVTLPPANYTAVLRGVNDTSGVGLVEVYDLDMSKPVELGNLSVRANVLTDDNVLIAGIITVGGTPKRIVFRGIGPSLKSSVPGALDDPTLELHDGNGALLMSNDNWKQAPNAAEIQATGLAPSDDRESAILMTLPAGNYTSILRGVNRTTGIALAEAYKLNQ